MTEGIPKGYVARDSVGRCDHQGDLYSLIRNPNAPLKSKTVIAAPKDTVESIQQGLNKQVREKFFKGKTVFALEVFQLIGKIGKLIFMVIVLPPYLIMFSLPKFIVTRAIPRLVELVIIAPFHRFIRVVQKQKQKIVLIFQRISAFLKVVNRLANKIRVLGKYIKETLIQAKIFFRHAATFPYKQTQKIIEFLRTTFFPAIEKRQEQLKQKIKNIVAIPKQWVLKKFESFADKLNTLLIEPAKAIIIPVAKKIGERVGAFQKLVDTKIKLVKASIKHFVENPIQVLTSFKEKVVRLAIEQGNKISTKTVEIVQRNYRELSAIAMDMRAQFYDLVADRLKLAKAEAIQWGVTAKEKIKEAGVILWNGIVYLPAQLNQSIRKIPVDRFKIYLSRIGERFGSASNQLMKQFKKASEAIKSVIDKLIITSKNTSTSLWEGIWKRLKTIPLLIKEWGTKAIALIVDGAKKTLFGVRVAVAWISVLLSYGMELVKEAAQELINSLNRWLSHPESPNE